MKRTVLIAAGIAAMMLMSACSGGAKGQAGTAQATTTAAETTTAAATTEETTEDTSAPKIEVTDAVTRSIEVDGGGKFDYKIPKITISGVNTDAANETIRSDTERKYYEGENKDNYDSRYQSFVNDKTISVLLFNMDLTGGDYQYIQAYVIDLKTGKLLTNSEVVKLCGMSDDEFFKMAKEKYEEFNKNNFQNDKSKEAEAAKKENLTFISYDHLNPYMDKEGRLCFVGFINWEGGAGNGYYCFDHSQ